MLRSLSFILFYLLLFSIDAQNKKIKIKKEDGFFFFQKGPPSDTISKNKHDLFYLKLSEKNCCTIRIEIQNGQFQKTGTDTIYRLVRINGINYQHFFSDSTWITEIKKSHFTKQEKITKPCSNFKTLVNGPNTLTNSNEISIRFFKGTGDSLLLKNKFIYR